MFFSYPAIRAVSNLGMLLGLLLLSACGSTPERATLADIDKPGGIPENDDTAVFNAPKTEAEIKRAYEEYLQNAAVSENSRLAAITRLAEIEYELSNRLLENKSSPDNDSIADQQYDAALNTTIALLSSSLKDYPNAKNNDQIHYQLSKAYDQKGNGDASLDQLQQLVSKHPKSKHYIEAQFRIAESAFARRQYADAELAYSEVIQAPEASEFYEKSLFKRGWSRFKQQFYYEAIDDLVAAINFHDFAPVKQLDKSEKDEFDEYFRSIGLAFSYLGGVDALNDYFSTTEFDYAYHTYATVSDIYLKQERFTDAVTTLRAFNEQQANSPFVPYAHLKIIQVWQNSGFTNKIYSEMETFYSRYNADSAYWRKQDSEDEYTNDISKSVHKSLREYVQLMATYFHNRYQKKPQKADLQQADLWYQRYLKHYQEYVRQDNIYTLYAELLEQSKQYKKALRYYELAAYDGDLILSKEAAYSTIAISSKLFKQSSNNQQYLNLHIRYSLLYSQIYPNDPQTENIIIHAAKVAFQSKQYARAIELSELLSNTNSRKTHFSTKLIKANAYFKLKRFEQAEASFSDILKIRKVSSKDRQKIQDSMAVAIYRQAEAAKEANNIADAHRHFSRIISVAPKSEIASTGLYDAIALSIEHERWADAIRGGKQFQRMYPKHKLSNDVSKKLTAAYLKSNLSLEAASELERMSSFESNREVKMAALWQAAELYESKNDNASAIRSYGQYAKEYRDPYPQYVEAMSKLVTLHQSNKQNQQALSWQKKIIQAAEKVSESKQTSRTRLLTSQATLALAKNKHQEFSRYKLVEPLKKNLKRKKAAMQDAVKLYGQTSRFNIASTTTESTHAIASIYETFSQELLDSERPKNLNDDQLEQYEILLEDQAFPFEEKAIEFFEINMSHTNSGKYDDWVRKSHKRLKVLFPGRYNRNAKTDAYIHAKIQ